MSVYVIPSGNYTSMRVKYKYIKTCRKSKYKIRVRYLEGCWISKTYNDQKQTARLAFKHTWVQPKLPLHSLYLPPLSSPPCAAPVGDGRIPAGWGLSPGRTGALSPEGRGCRLTDSLATSDQAERRQGERDRA